METLDRIVHANQESRPQIPAHIDVVPSNDRERAIRIWHDLEKRLENTSATNSADWTAVWLGHFGNKVPHVFVFGKDEDHYVGATLVTNPVMKPGNGKVPIKSVLIGTVGEAKDESPDLTDHRLLVGPEHREMFAEGVMQTIAALPWRWDQLLLQGYDPVDAAALARGGEKVGIPLSLRHVRFPVFNFDKARGEGHTDIVAALRTNKGRIAKSREKISTAVGPLKGEWAGNVEDAQEIFTELVQLNRERWRRLGEPGFFPTEDSEHYYRDLIDTLLPQGKASVYRLKAGDITLGCILNFMDLDGVVIGYTGGINLDKRVANYVPGLLTHTAYMQECLDRGYSQYDFGWGGERYKVDLSNAEDGLDFGFAYRGVKGHTLELARNTFYHYRDNRAIEESAKEVRDAYRQFRRNPRDVKGSGMHLVQHATSLGKEIAKHTYTTTPHLQEVVKHAQSATDTTRRVGSRVVQKVNAAFLVEEATKHMKQIGDRVRRRRS